MGIYGEWCHSTHGSEYDLLPELFIAYDIYDPDAGKFFDTKKTRRLLMEVGFCVPQLLHEGPVKNWEQLEKFCNEPSPFSSKDKREGIYVKVSDGAWIVNRYKMVRSGFVQGCKWSDQYLTKNKLVKN